MNNVKDNYTRNVMIKSTVIMAVLIFITIVVLIPIYILFVNATRDPQAITNQPLSFIPGTSFFRNIKETINLNKIGIAGFSVGNAACDNDLIPFFKIKGFDCNLLCAVEQNVSRRENVAHSGCDSP